MNEEDLNRLFLSALDDPEQDTQAVRKVFARLIRSTLAYRDGLLSKRGTGVTVRDVREALDWLVFALATGEVPETIGEIQKGLLESWVAALREHSEAMGTPR